MQRIKMRLLAAVMCLVMAAPVTASANADDIERLNKIISELPAEEDITEEHFFSYVLRDEKLIKLSDKGYDVP